MNIPQQGDSAPDDKARAAGRDESALRNERADLVRGVLARRTPAELETTEDEQAAPIDLGQLRAEVGATELSPRNDEPAAPAVLGEVEPEHGHFDVSVEAAVPDALALLRKWAQAQIEDPDAADPEELDRVLRDPEGERFVRRLIDEVIRPDDFIASGFGIHDLAEQIPDEFGTTTRRLFKLGALVGPGVPFVAVPLMRHLTRRLFDHELTPANRLEQRLAEIAAADETPRVRPLCEPVFGENGFNALQQRLLDLAARPEPIELEMAVDNLDYLDNDWDFSGNADRAATRLTSVLMQATDGDNSTYVQLRTTNADHLELAIETFMRALDMEGLEQVRAGIEIPADYPESITLLRRLSGWAHLRREDGGAAIRIAVTRRPDRSNELAEAKLRSTPPLCYENDADVDANAVRLIDAVLAPEHHGTLELEVGITSRFDVALALQLNRKRGALAPVSVVVPAGTPQRVRKQLREAGAQVRTRLGLLPEGGDLRAGTRYLRSRLAERALLRRDDVDASAEQSPHALSPAEQRLIDAIDHAPELAVGRTHIQHRVNPEDAPGVTSSIPFEMFPPGLFADEPDAPRRDWSESFVAAQSIVVDENATTVLGGHAPGYAQSSSAAAHFEAAADQAQASSESEDDAEAGTPRNPADTGAQPDLTEVVLGLRRGRPLRNTFNNEPVSDHTQPSVRAWAMRILRRTTNSELGVAEAEAHLLETADDVGRVLDSAHAASEQWSSTSGWERAAHLEAIARALEANRARLIEVAVSETGLTFAEVDADVSHAIDLANYDAQLARQLDRMQGAHFEPVRVCLAVPGWIPPVSSTAAAVLAGLAAGSAVVVKPSPRTRRTAAILVRVLWAAGIDEQLLQLAVCDERLFTDDQLGEQLITNERVERVLMQGTYETAQRFMQWRRDLPLVGSSGGKSSVVVTASADYDQAAAAIARSVVASLGQGAARPSNAILVGSVGRSERFTQQLADAIAAVRIGYPSDPAVHVGPLVSRPTAKQLEALTELAEGERWLLEPRALDDAGRLWTPGIRVGVTPASPSARNDAPVPVINLLRADSLREAVAIQNRIDYGLAAGLYALDRAEIAEWVQLVQAGNLYINRDMLGIAVQRQPFGGWSRSMIGTKAKSGGPNTLVHLGRWRAEPGEQSQTLHLRGLEEKTQRLIEALQPGLDYEAFERVRTTAVSCQIAWNEEFGEVIDRANLGVERNLFRYRPVECLIRAAEDASLTELGQVLVAASVARAPLLLSVAEQLPQLVVTELEHRGAKVRVESDAEFLERMERSGLQQVPRMRLVGGSRSAVTQCMRNVVDCALYSDDATLAGRVEMLPFLREQVISVTANRFGHQDDRVSDLFPHERTPDE